MNKKKIILVDDNALILEGISKSLTWSALGCEIVGMFYEAQSVIDCLQEQPVDIIISDIVLPDMTGLAMAKDLLNDHPCMKLILISAYEDFQYAQEAIRIGVFDYLGKPIDYMMLSKIVQRAVAALDNEKLSMTTFQSVLDSDKAFENAIVEALRERNIDEAKANIERLSEAYTSKHYNRADTFMSLYSLMGIILGITDEEGVDMNDMKEEIIKSLHENSDSTSALFDLLYRVCVCVCDRFNGSSNYHLRLCNEICDYIDTNYSNPELNVNLISNVFGISPTYVSVIFKKSKKENLIDRIINKRLEVSRELLRTTDLSIKTISTMVGYNNQYYFSASFKKKYGIVPSLWKKNG